MQSTAWRDWLCAAASGGRAVVQAMISTSQLSDRHGVLALSSVIPVISSSMATKAHVGSSDSSSETASSKLARVTSIARRLSRSQIGSLE